MSPHAARRRLRATTPPYPGGAIRLHIERIVLHGAPRTELVSIAAAVETELALLATQPGLRFGSADAASAPAVRIAAGSTPERTGRAVAGAVWSSVASVGQGASR